MGIERVRAFFEELGIEGRILEFSVSSATVPLAALALGCEEARIAKTLSMRVGTQAVLIVTAGDARLDNQKYKARFQCKAAMLTPQEAQEETGHAVGGVCPFAVKPGVAIYLDVSLRRFDQIYPACGSANSAIALNPDELETYSRATGWVDVCRLPVLFEDTFYA
jgi:prolyl-tRNA editing enzyme YbaK/EbsC (Cys-tRNA(Pro) deacylase)